MRITHEPARVQALIDQTLYLMYDHAQVWRQPTRRMRSLRNISIKLNSVTVLIQCMKSIQLKNYDWIFKRSLL